MRGITGIPPPAAFRPQVFSTSRRLSPPPASQACFIPRPRPGFVSVQGFVPDSQRATARRRCLPPCRSDAPAHRQAGCHRHARRLRGVAPRIDAFRRTRRLDPARGRSPLRVLSSLRYQLGHRELRNPPGSLVNPSPSAHDVERRALRSCLRKSAGPAVRLQRVVSSSADAPSRRASTCTRFRAVRSCLRRGSNDRKTIFQIGRAHV